MNESVARPLTAGNGGRTEGCRVLEIVPLHCPACGEASYHALAWVQENFRAVCRHCGTGFGIDKDRLAVWLAEQERDAPAGPALVDAPAGD